MWNRNVDPASSQDDSQRLPGVIDTIGLGYEAVLARPVLILPPILLDLYFWLGVHVTSRPLAMQAGQWLREWFDGDKLASTVEDGGTHNITELAALWMPTLRIPTFVSTLSSDAPYRLESWRPALNLPWWGVALAAVVLVLTGLLIGAEYLLSIAAATSKIEDQTRRPYGAGVFNGAVRLAGWYATIIGLGALVLWPVIAGFVGSELSGAGASFWLVLLLAFPVSWAFVLFFFSAQAMFVENIGPLAALRSSVRVVRSDSWNSLGIIVVYFLLTTGFLQVWGLFVTQPLGLVVAIVGHAIIGTGIIAATMVFYRDRVQRLHVAGRI